MQLQDINITHISLVKKGANGKTLIYKSAGKPGNYTKSISIRKVDEEGVVYGVVYTPDVKDSQGDIATAQEIKKASYNFMKNKRTDNIDIEHSFDNVDAFVAESWIVQKRDEHFPDDVGAWAVAIQLESEELKKMAKDGEIASLSMAGEAIRKSTGDTKARLKVIFENLLDIITGFSVDIWTDIRKGEDINMDQYRLELSDKIKKATRETDKLFNTITADVTQIKKSTDEQANMVEEQSQTIDKLKAQLKEKDTKLAELSAKVAALETDKGASDAKIAEVEEISKENREALKKSKQNRQPNTKTKNPGTPNQGVL